MRRLLLLLALAVSATLLLTAPPATAGGPTSVLITDPSTGQAAGLYYSDAAYEDLGRMLAEGERLDDKPAGLGSPLNLTWMIHDVEPWQHQQLYLHADGGPVVATYGSEMMANAEDVSWVRPAEGKALLLLVDQVFEGVSSADPAADPAPAADPVATETVVTETAW